MRRDATYLHYVGTFGRGVIAKLPTAECERANLTGDKTDDELEELTHDCGATVPQTLRSSEANHGRY